MMVFPCTVPRLAANRIDRTLKTEFQGLDDDIFGQISGIVCYAEDSDAGRIEKSVHPGFSINGAEVPKRLQSLIPDILPRSPPENEAAIFGFRSGIAFELAVA